jgi:hypothetical protein
MADDDFNQAEAMLHRVSPEGRRHARRAAERERRAMWHIIGRCLLVVLAVAILSAGWTSIVGPLGSRGQALALLVALLGCAYLVLDDRRRPTSAAALATAELPALPRQTEAWVADQRRLLPAPAATLLDGIAVRIDALAPQLARLDPATPAADDVRKLLAHELPALVERYHAVPATLRGESQAAGGTANTHLLHGLGVVDRQLDELTRQIAAGATDGLATQGRYLDNKYRGDTV